MVKLLDSSRLLFFVIIIALVSVFIKFGKMTQINWNAEVFCHATITFAFFPYNIIFCDETGNSAVVNMTEVLAEKKQR